MIFIYSKFLGEKTLKNIFWRKSLVEIVLEVLMHNFSDSERKSQRKNPFRFFVGKLAVRLAWNQISILNAFCALPGVQLGAWGYSWKRVFICDANIFIYTVLKHESHFKYANICIKIGTRTTCFVCIPN